MRTSSAIDHLIVYGTLLRAVQHPCHAILAELCDFIGRASFRGQLYDLGEYPGVQIVDATTDLAYGELYRFRDAERALAKLDAYESHDPHHPHRSLFCRTAVDVFQLGVPTQNAWVYCYHRSVLGMQRIASGDYLQFLRAKANRLA